MNTTLQIRVDSGTKKKAKKVFDDLGLDISSGVKLYLAQVVKNKGIPFRLVTENGYTPQEEAAMIKEAKETKQKGRIYATPDELFRDLGI